MARSQYSLVIHCPVEDVFAYMADMSHDPHWRSGVIAMRPVSGPFQEFGSRHVEVRRVPGRVIETPAEITAFEPNRRISFQRASGPVRPRGTYLYESTADGTRVTFILEVPLLGMWRLAAPVVTVITWLIVRMSRKDFAKLRSLLESPASTSA
jgi:uncharacterized membrane protein